jgi:hypothetical protein
MRLPRVGRHFEQRRYRNGWALSGSSTGARQIELNASKMLRGQQPLGNSRIQALSTFDRQVPATRSSGARR